MKKAWRNKYKKRKSVLAINGKNPTGKNRNGQNQLHLENKDEKFILHKRIVYVCSLQVKLSKCPNFGNI